MWIMHPEIWTLSQAVTLFAVAAGIIALAGTRITRTVDQLADRTRIGEAAAGAILLGASTSLGGIVLSVTAAAGGNPELAVSNAVGGIAVQTSFLAFADMAYRRANLEHAAVSLPNMMQSTLLISLLALLLLAPHLPDFTLTRIHPVTPLLFIVYIYGIKLVRTTREAPMWRPSITRETRQDIPEEDAHLHSLPRLLMEFLGLMGVLGTAGWLLEPAATVIAREAGISHTVIGILLTAISTSIPELVTSIAAVRQGALTLAVGGIIGGNAFDVLFVAGSDIAYRDGSIYHTIAGDTSMWITLTLLMVGVLLMGLIRRERFGFARIGLESVVIVLLFAAGVAVMLT